MAWNSSPEIRDLGDYSKKHDFKQLIVVAIRDDGRFEILSYGRNAKLCEKAKLTADQIFDMVNDGTINVVP